MIGSRPLPHVDLKRDKRDSRIPGLNTSGECLTNKKTSLAFLTSEHHERSSSLIALKSQMAGLSTALLPFLEGAGGNLQFQSRLALGKVVFLPPLVETRRKTLGCRGTNFRMYRLRT
jgi:hypothetical protein